MIFPFLFMSCTKQTSILRPLRKPLRPLRFNLLFLPQRAERIRQRSQRIRQILELLEVPRSVEDVCPLHLVVPCGTAYKIAVLWKFLQNP